MKVHIVLSDCIKCLGTEHSHVSSHFQLVSHIYVKKRPKSQLHSVRKPVRVVLLDFDFILCRVQEMYLSVQCSSSIGQIIKSVYVSVSE